MPRWFSTGTGQPRNHETTKPRKLQNPTRRELEPFVQPDVYGRHHETPPLIRAQRRHVVRLGRDGNVAHAFAVEPAHRGRNQPAADAGSPGVPGDGEQADCSAIGSRAVKRDVAADRSVTFSDEHLRGPSLA